MWKVLQRCTKVCSLWIVCFYNTNFIETQCRCWQLSKKRKGESVFPWLMHYVGWFTNDLSEMNREGLVWGSWGLKGVDCELLDIMTRRIFVWMMDFIICCYIKHPCILHSMKYIFICFFDTIYFKNDQTPFSYCYICENDIFSNMYCECDIILCAFIWQECLKRL